MKKLLIIAILLMAITGQQGWAGDVLLTPAEYNYLKKISDSRKPESGVSKPNVKIIQFDSRIFDPCLTPEARKAQIECLKRHQESVDRYEEIYKNWPKDQFRPMNPYLSGWLDCYKPQPKKGYWQVKKFNLSDDVLTELYKSGVTMMILLNSPVYLKMLNRLLKEGWELQNKYNGEESVYLKRWVQE